MQLSCQSCCRDLVALLACQKKLWAGAHLLKTTSSPSSRQTVHLWSFCRGSSWDWKLLCAGWWVMEESSTSVSTVVLFFERETEVQWRSCSDCHHLSSVSRICTLSQVQTAAWTPRLCRSGLTHLTFLKTTAGRGGLEESSLDVRGLSQSEATLMGSERFC